MNGETIRISKAVYGGDGLARTGEGEVVLVPFVLPGELVVLEAAVPARVARVVERSPERATPRCAHFGVCGGCQYQMATYTEQLAMKVAILQETMARAGIADLPALHVRGSPEPWGYRNRVRLRVREVEGVLRLGYSERGSKDFLPITMCPIAAQVLWDAAEALMQVSATDRAAAAWLGAAAEVEIGCDAEGRQVQVLLLCSGVVPKERGGLAEFAEAVKQAGLALASMGASRLHAASGRALEPIAHWGAEGLMYPVGTERFWLERGGFFQVNRFLLPEMPALVAGERRGSLAWDLYAGVGLFARALRERFAQVTAVEANAAAVRELRRGLRRGGDVVVEATTLTFLRQAAVQRDRPALVVLDPPRAGAGEEVCLLLAGLGPEEIVYVSCDPTTLARDADVLMRKGYVVTRWHMLDLFPQTYHLETVMVLQRKGVAG